MKNSRILTSIIFSFTFLVVATLALQGNSSFGPSLTDDFVESNTQDTIPIKDRYGDFVTDDYYNPFDMLPSIIEQEVEYDFETGQYVVLEKNWR